MTAGPYTLPQYDSLPAYEQPVVSTKDFAKNAFKDPGRRAKEYVISLFPIAQWIYRYNLQWLYGDLIAGITVGAVLVPQGMSYATIATLPPEYGLYSSFVGVFMYCFFATSKDVSIGPVAVMSLQVSKVIAHVTAHYPQYASDGPMIATALALMCGAIAFGIGLLRLGFILEFIPIPAVMGFMTGSALNILSGQLPGLFGTSKLFNTRAATYEVIINTLKYLPKTKLDAAFGLVPLFLLYFFKWFFNFAAKRWPKYSRAFFFGSVLRNAVIIIFATLISWEVCKGHKASGKFPISIIKTVPSGLKHTGVPTINKSLIDAIAGEIPISVVILLLEHIAISKSFGRVNDYKINPNQELIAIGVTNLVGTFFNAYPATGSFSRSALKSKCGVRTPLAGIFTGAVVLIAIYALTSAFYWIPNATLSAIIIHAVGDLMAHPKTTFRFWRTSPVEAVIFVAAVLFTVFITIESGIYFAIAASIVLLLLRVAFPSGQFLGRVEYCHVSNPLIVKPDDDSASIAGSASESYDNKKVQPISSVEPVSKIVSNGNSSGTSITEVPGRKSGVVEERSPKEPPQSTPTGLTLSNKHKQYKWVPLNHKNINPDVQILPPPPGVVVFRPTESFTYPNCSRQADILIDEVSRITKRGLDPGREVKLGDRPWNDHGPRHRKVDPDYIDPRPILRAVVFDLSATPHVDLTGVQCLVDIRQALDKYANRKVEYHFVGILSAWTRRALVAEGFGGDSSNPPEQHYVQAAPRIDPRFRGLTEGLLNDDVDYAEEDELPKRATDEEQGDYIPVLETNTPFFHFDIPNFDE
ncbi:sulfate permease 1 [Trichomonascus vanleenenianus]|uniref:SLC26/SulP family anion transporter n=1 Tax=Trichomonascus vanleenenianus TaxID=2268995 RepID=UPI003ECB9549